MRDIGPIVHLQIQRAALKTGTKGDRRYSPTPLLAVERLRVTPAGVLGQSADRSWIVDVHHAAHPESRHDGGANGVSIGFTAHYDLMRERFGDRLTLGSAGENVIARSPRLLALADIAGGLSVVAPDGSERARLRVLQVARPCRPFAGWALGATVTPGELQEHLQFLENGMRGFYCVAEDAGGDIRVGDRLIVV